MQTQVKYIKIHADFIDLAFKYFLESLNIVQMFILWYILPNIILKFFQKIPIFFNLNIAS